MNINRTSSFASGLIVATLICTIAYFLSPRDVSSNERYVEIPTEEEAKSLLIDKGYVIQTRVEWESQQNSLSNAQSQKNSVRENESENPTLSKNENEEVVYQTILNVSTGMTSIDVGNVLVQAGIVDRPMTFVQEVEKKGVANKLRPGTYEINSNMTMNDVISIIFK
ncbi:hypothetical protein ACFSCX_12830 [Bacillus salitolerans]|uniref:Aminodeoxychorismate lyase n=1 Tax=Bacillus salitolerans TaxID=1437434 RepID=A0ABW4LTJ1_9BACI